jgi:hypothetical protein
MNCPGCNAPFDYRFLTTCSYCGFEQQPAETDALTSLSNCGGSDLYEKPHTLARSVQNFALVLALAFTGLLVGGFVAYIVGGTLYLVFASHGGNPSEECARGTGFAVLSILSGSFIGAAGGSVLAAKHIFQNADLKTVSTIKA